MNSQSGIEVSTTVMPSGPAVTRTAIGSLRAARNWKAALTSARRRSGGICSMRSRGSRANSLSAKTVSRVASLGKFRAIRSERSVDAATIINYKAAWSCAASRSRAENRLAATNSRVPKRNQSEHFRTPYARRWRVRRSGVLNTSWAISRANRLAAHTSRSLHSALKCLRRRPSIIIKRSLVFEPRSSGFRN